MFSVLITPKLRLNGKTIKTINANLFFVHYIF